MNNKYVYGAIALTFIVAVLALFTPVTHNLASAVANVTSNLPSMGLNRLEVGTGCDQQYTSCTGTLVVGGVLATTTQASMTLAPSDLNFGVIAMNPTVGSITVTLPATTTSPMSSFLPNAGDETEVMFYNASTTVAQDITLAGGTGTLLSKASTSAAVRSGSNPGMALLKFIRKANTDIAVFMSNSN